MATSKEAVAICIDLGMTNACVAVWRNNRVEVIPNKVGDFRTPSWVAYTDKEVLIGKTAKNNAYKNPHGTVFAIKRIIGKKYNYIVVQEAIQNWQFNVQEDSSGRPKIEILYKNETKRVYPEEISGLILREMKEAAEAYLGRKNVTDAVITVPAYFNDHQRQATKDAAKIAGLNVLRLINEPTAAVIAYIYDKFEKRERNVLVYDLGGATFDVSIVSVEDCNVKVKATRGDTNLGGTNFDDRCITYFTELIETKYKINLTEWGKLKFLERLRRQVKRAKHELSTSGTSNIELDAVYKEIDVFEDLTRVRFDDLNVDLYNKTFKLVEECIEEAKLKKSDIDDVVLVGGSTCIPKIQERLEDIFGKPVSKAIDPDQAVAHGAAILAAKFNGTMRLPLNIIDVTPMSLGIDTLNLHGDVKQVKRTYTRGVKEANRSAVLEATDFYHYMIK